MTEFNNVYNNTVHNPYRLKLCKTDFKDAKYYLDEAKKLGYKVYKFFDKLYHEEFYCVDILDYNYYWRDPSLVSRSTGNNIVVYEFKEAK